MATTNDIYAEMQRYAPLELAESWDNPGLLVDCGREVSRVLVTLDITPEVVEEAAAGGCELIVSHHPVIFSPLKKLTPRDVSFQLVQKGISAICMHTNLDAAEGGVNEVLAGIFGMRDWEFLQVSRFVFLLFLIFLNLYYKNHLSYFAACGVYNQRTAPVPARKNLLTTSPPPH